MAKKKMTNPVKAKKKIIDSLEILKALGLPREQQNDRSALTLLSLLNLKPNNKWIDAQAPLIGNHSDYGFLQNILWKAVRS